ncbi:MAG: hypothetical protein FWE38_04260 [Firmicutes bacterium]|nr:hypothetical protein [Bacillota bacterium]
MAPSGQSIGMAGTKHRKELKKGSIGAKEFPSPPQPCRNSITFINHYMTPMSWLANINMIMIQWW